MPTHTPGGGGRGPWRDARTFTAATFFAHLLTLRMFRVYFFNPVTLRKDKKREKNEEGERTHLGLVFPPSGFYIISICILFFFFVFFVLTVTPAWNQVIPTGMGCQRALCLESSRTRKQCTLTLPSPLQKLKRLWRLRRYGSHKQCHYRFFLSLLSHTGAQTKSVDV